MYVCIYIYIYIYIHFSYAIHSSKSVPCQVIDLLNVWVLLALPSRRLLRTARAGFEGCRGSSLRSDVQAAFEAQLEAQLGAHRGGIFCSAGLCQAVTQS